jgi:hypothetical protein
VVRGPGVVVLTGSGGGLDARRAGLLASHGFPALALAYFTFPGRPAWLVEQPLEYFEAGFAWLRRQPGVRGRVRVMGISRGGELALLLGATFAEVAAVVAYVPSSVVWGPVVAYPSSVLQAPLSAWSYRGVPLPSMEEGERSFVPRWRTRPRWSGPASRWSAPAARCC